MKATEKEIKCIDFSLNIRQEVLKKKYEELKQNKTPLLVSPKGFIKHFWQDYSVTVKMLSFWKRIAYQTMFSIIYIIALPFIFILGFIDLFLPANKKKKNETKETYLIDYEVSENKSFSTLWDLKGLRNWGVGYYHLSGFNEDDQLSCIISWSKILYDLEKNEVLNIYDDIRNRISKSRQEFYANNPDGHISMISPIQALPDEIQNRFGNYKP